MSAKVGREYSTRLGTLLPVQFQAALDRFHLGEFIHAEPVPFGNFGQNVFLTSTRGDYVLRGAPHYSWQFLQERFFTQLLHERTSVPVPWPYLVDPCDDIFGWSYVIMPRMPGRQLSDPAVQQALSASDRRGIATAMGKTLARMQALTGPYAGEYDLATDAVQPLGVAYADWVISRMRDYLQMAVPLSDRTTSADVVWVEQVITQGREALDVPFEPCFVMEDYKEGNAVAESRGGTWAISGVFDYMGAYFGDGEADLSRQIAVYAEEDVGLARAFARAYVAQRAVEGRPLRPGASERFPIYMLLDRLIIWQFGQRHGVWWDAGLCLREWASPYTSLEVL